jgi:ribonuclease P protein component
MQRRLRLRHSRDFTRLRQQGSAYHDRLMLISVLPNGLDHNRYGFITSRALGNAVTRNRVRRHLREAVRDLHPRLKPGYDVVVVGKRAVVEKPFALIVRTVCRLAEQAGLLLPTGERDASLACP